MTAQGKITAANAIPGTIVRIVKESDATAALFEREPEFTAARIKRGSVLAEVIENIALGGGKRRLVTKFGDVTVVGHQTFILAKDGEQAEEPAPAAVEIAPEVAELDENPAVAEKMVIALPEPTFALSEQEIEENAAAKLADTIRRDEEMQAEASREREETERLIQEARDGITAALDAIEALNLPEVEEKQAEAEISKSRELLDGEEPWEAKRHAKRTAERWAHIVRLRKEYADAPEWRKERITDALNAYGAVLYPAGTPEHEKYGQDLTAALSEWKTTGEDRWIIEFRRIGRVESPKPLYVACFERPDALAEKIHRYAAKFLTSRSFEVDVNILGASGTVLIEGGRFGEGTIRKE